MADAGVQGSYQEEGYYKLWCSSGDGRRDINEGSRGAIGAPFLEALALEIGELKAASLDGATLDALLADLEHLSDEEILDVIAWFQDKWSDEIYTAWYDIELRSRSTK